MLTGGVVAESAATVTRCPGLLLTEFRLCAACLEVPQRSGTIALFFFTLDLPVVLRFPLTDDLGLAPPSGAQENEGGYWRTVLGSGGQPPPILPQGLPLVAPPGGHSSTPGPDVPGRASGNGQGRARGGGVRRSQNVCLRGVGKCPVW